MHLVVFCKLENSHCACSGKAEAIQEFKQARLGQKKLACNAKVCKNGCIFAAACSKGKEQMLLSISVKKTSSAQDGEKGKGHSAR